MSDTTPPPTPAHWQAVDDHLSALLVGHDDALEQARAAQDAAGLPAIEVVPLTGKLLHLLARIAGARRILEIGTLGGYSTIWLARAVGEGGLVTTIEAEPVNAAVARRNLERAGVADRVEVVEGRAAEVLPGIDGPYDMIFIDADKESNTLYLDAAACLGRAGAVVVVDNVVRAGRIVDAENHDAQVEGVRRGLEMLAIDPRFDATAVQTLDAKGWDGFAVALLVDPSVTSGGRDARRH